MVKALGNNVASRDQKSVKVKEKGDEKVEATHQQLELPWGDEKMMGGEKRKSEK